ncbi:hypothetical protein ACFL1N_05995 [Thermodesulfobacteriota bacterium]
MKKIKKYKRKKVSRFFRKLKSSNVKIYVVIIVLCMVMSVCVSYMVNKGGNAIEKAERFISIAEEITGEESEEIKNMVLDGTINPDRLDEQQKQELREKLDNMDDDKLEELKQEYKDKLSEEEIEKLKQMYKE